MYCEIRTIIVVLFQILSVSGKNLKFIFCINFDTYIWFKHSTVFPTGELSGWMKVKQVNSRFYCTYLFRLSQGKVEAFSIYY